MAKYKLGDIIKYEDDPTNDKEYSKPSGVIISCVANDDDEDKEVQYTIRPLGYGDHHHSNKVPLKESEIIKLEKEDFLYNILKEKSLFLHILTPEYIYYELVKNIHYGYIEIDPTYTLKLKNVNYAHIGDFTVLADNVLNLINKNKKPLPIKITIEPETYSDGREYNCVAVKITQKIRNVYQD